MMLGMMFESCVIGDCKRMKGRLHASTSGSTAVHPNLHSSGTRKQLWCDPNELPILTQLALHNKALLNA